MQPMAAAASAPITASGAFGTKPATRSPGFSPSARRCCDRRLTRSCSSAWEIRRFTLSSPQNTMASPSPPAAEKRSMFSA